MNLTPIGSVDHDGYERRVALDEEQILWIEVVLEYTAEMHGRFAPDIRRRLDELGVNLVGPAAWKTWHDFVEQSAMIGEPVSDELEASMAELFLAAVA